jgi:Lrp/AsnC family leucine-responsive transcriptional regulator
VPGRGAGHGLSGADVSGELGLHPAGGVQVQQKEGNEIDTVMSSYYGEEQVTAIINLKVDTKAADTIAEKVSKYALVEDVFLVTGDTDIVVKTKFHNYNQLKRFLVDDISTIDGVKDTKTLMVVTTFKERGTIISEPQEPNK